MIVLLLLCLFSVVPSLCHAASPAEEYLNDPDAFFTESAPYLDNDGGDIVLKMTTPLPVLCAVHYLPSSEQNLQWFVQTMDMTEPAEIHSVVLGSMDPAAGDHKIALTAFLPGPSQAVLLSATYTSDPTMNPPSLSVDGVTGAQAPSPLGACTFELQVSEALVGSATLQLSEQPPLPVVYSLGRALEDESPTYDLSRESATTAISSPNLVLQGLEAESTYLAEACFVDTARDVCCTPTVSLMTEASTGEASSCFGPNAALLDKGAVVNGVSSNWSNQDNDGSFGANNAIDGVASSAWSSNEEGDDAWIEIKLPMPQQIAGVGVWSRTMTTSSEIRTFQLTLSDSTSAVAQSKAANTIGPLELKDASQLYTFDLTDEQGEEIPMVDLIRLDVLTSTQFNTGLMSLEVYPLVEGCLQQPGPTSSPNVDPDDLQAGPASPTGSPTSGPVGAPAMSPASSPATRGALLTLLLACTVLLV